ncbi:hypothetical protein ATPR_1116 [Acetobacter tropicalis NBRC 101654]|uniref:Uncharacterized protein n=1 Tax=Acetobacter tropicalis NBRC 101654 TaxID=749388 RepID=F7VCL7_9PROT|nr:hypothetical protein ATPR_1116 [Acetobacter tropicalis NBRC 101654]
MGGYGPEQVDIFSLQNRFSTREPVPQRFLYPLIRLSRS